MRKRAQVTGEDYVSTSGMLSFVAGQTSASVSVPVLGDTDVEPTELFTLDLSRPAAAVSIGSAEVLDDDAGTATGVPTINVSGSSNVEGTGSDSNILSWTITLDAPATERVDVGYRVLAGTGSVSTASRVTVGETEPEGIRSVTFYCGTRKERRNVRGVIFTSLIHDYVKFNFPVLAFSGARGEPHPPPTPEDEDEE